jgi:dihydroorotate dehydrogenase
MAHELENKQDQYLTVAQNDAKTKKIMKQLEGEFSRDRFGFEVSGYPRFFEAKLNRDKLEIFKPEGIGGSLLIEIIPESLRKGAEALKFKISFPNTKGHMIDVPKKHLAILKDRLTSERQTPLYIKIKCIDHQNFAVDLKLNLNPKFLK